LRKVAFLLIIFSIQVGSRLEGLQARISDDSMAWLIEDDDDPDIVILSSSPVVTKNDGADKNIGATDLKLMNEGSSGEQIHYEKK